MIIKKLNLEQLEDLYNNSKTINFGMCVNTDLGCLTVGVSDVDLLFGSKGFGLCVNGINESINWTYTGESFDVVFYEKAEIEPPHKVAQLNFKGERSSQVNIQFILKED